MIETIYSLRERCSFCLNSGIRWDRRSCGHAICFQCIQSQRLSSELNNTEMMECSMCLDANHKRETDEPNQEETGVARERQANTQRVSKITSDILPQKPTDLYREKMKLKPQEISLPPPLLERYTTTANKFDDEKIVERKWKQPRMFTKSCTDLCPNSDTNQSTKFRKCPKGKCQVDFGFQLDYNLSNNSATERDGNLKQVDRSTGTNNEGGDYEEVGDNASLYFSCGESPNKSLTNENYQNETFEKAKNSNNCCSEHPTEKHTRNKDVPSNCLSHKIIETCRQQLMHIQWDSLTLRENQIKCATDNKICNLKTKDETAECSNCGSFKICKVLLQLMLACSVIADKSVKMTEVLLKSGHKVQCVSPLRTLKDIIDILLQQANLASILSHEITEDFQKLTCSGAEHFHPKNLREINSQNLTTLINDTKSDNDSTVTLSKESHTPQKEKTVSNTCIGHIKTKSRKSMLRPFKNPIKENNNRPDDSIGKAESVLETSGDNAFGNDIQKHIENVSPIEPYIVLEPGNSLDLGSKEKKTQRGNQIHHDTTVDVFDEPCSVRSKTITEYLKADKYVEDNLPKKADKTGNENVPLKENETVLTNGPVTRSGKEDGCIFEDLEIEVKEHISEKEISNISPSNDKPKKETSRSNPHSISDITTKPNQTKGFYEQFSLKEKRRQNTVKHTGTQVNSVDLTNYSNDLVSTTRGSLVIKSGTTKSDVVKRKLISPSSSINDAIQQSPAKYIRLQVETRPECKNDPKANNESTKNRRENILQNCKTSTPKCVPGISSSENDKGSRSKCKQNDPLLRYQQNTKTRNIKKDLFRTKDISSKTEVKCSSRCDVIWNEGKFRNVCIQIDLPEIKKKNQASTGILVYPSKSKITKHPIKTNEYVRKLTKSTQDSKLNEPSVFSSQQGTSDKNLHDGRIFDVKKTGGLEFIPKAMKITDVTGEEFPKRKIEVLSGSPEKEDTLTTQGKEDKTFTGYLSDSSSSEDDSLSFIPNSDADLKKKALNDYSAADDDLPHLLYPKRYRGPKRCQRLDYRELWNSTEEAVNERTVEYDCDNKNKSTNNNRSSNLKYQGCPLCTDLQTDLSAKKKEQHNIQSTDTESRGNTEVQSSDSDSDSRHSDGAKTTYNMKPPRRHRRPCGYSSSEEHIPPVHKRGFQYKKECMRILEKLYNLVISDPFRHEIKSKDIPDYYVVVKRGMSFDLIAYKLCNNIYEDLPQFLSDMRLVFDNCRLYYKNEQQFRIYANIVESYFEKLYGELLSEVNEF